MAQGKELAMVEGVNDAKKARTEWTGSNEAVSIHFGKT